MTARFLVRRLAKRRSGSVVRTQNPPVAAISTSILTGCFLIAAAYAHARSGAVDALETALLSGVTAARRAAMYGLAAAPAEGAVPLLLPLIDDDDHDVRSAAVFALGEAAEPSLEVIGALKTALHSAAGRCATLTSNSHYASSYRAHALRLRPRVFIRRLRGDDDGDLDAGVAGVTTGPGAMPGALWNELQVTGQAVYCLATKLATASSSGAEQTGKTQSIRQVISRTVSDRLLVITAAEEAVFELASELLAARNLQMLPAGVAEEELGLESDGAVNNKAPGLRRHGAHALLSLSSIGGSAEWRRKLTEAAMTATGDEDRYVQQPAWQAVQRLSKAQDEVGVKKSKADKLIDRLVELRLCPVTAVGSGF